MKSIPAVLTIAIFILSSVILVSGNAGGASPKDWGFYPEDMSVEVLFNRENITISEENIEGLVDNEKAIPTEDGYLLRSDYDGRFYTLIRYDNGSEGGLIIPYIDHGYSITIGLPLEETTISEDRIRKEIDTLNDPLASPDLRWEMYDMGYHLGKIDEDGSQTWIKGINRIVLEVDERRIDRMKFDLSTDSIDEITSDAWNILDIIGEDPMLFSIDTSDTVNVDIHVFSSHVSRDDVDWKEFMMGELEYLVGEGILKGIDEHTIGSVGNASSPGLSGDVNRILEFKGITGDDEGQWTSYLMTTFPFPDSIDASGPSITSSDIPSDYSSPVQNREMDLRILAIMLAFVILLLVSSRAIMKAQAGKLMKNAYRKHILDIVREQPGIHFREIMREIDIKQGVLSYHLNKMEKAELVRSKQDGMYRRFYPFNSRADIRLSLSDLQKDIMIHVMNDPGISKSGVSRETGRNQALIHYHVRFLKDAGLLWVDKEGKRTRLFVTGMGQSIISC